MKKRTIILLALAPLALAPLAACSERAQNETAEATDAVASDANATAAEAVDDVQRAGERALGAADNAVDAAGDRIERTYRFRLPTTESTP